VAGLARAREISDSHISVNRRLHIVAPYVVLISIWPRRARRDIPRRPGQKFELLFCRLFCLARVILASVAEDGRRPSSFFKPGLFLKPIVRELASAPIARGERNSALRRLGPRPFVSRRTAASATSGALVYLEGACDDLRFVLARSFVRIP